MKLDFYLLAFIAVAGIAIYASMNNFVLAENAQVLTENAQVVGLEKADGIVTVACGTDSMGLMLRCGDNLIYRDFGKNEEVVDGEVYVFKSPYTANTTTAHRAVWHNETHVLFKGDNNRVADPMVKISDILFVVLGVRFAE